MLEPFTLAFGESVELKPFSWTGCHPALIQLVMAAAADAHLGDYPLDKLNLKATLRGYYEDFWYGLSPEALSIVIKAAAGQSLKKERLQSVVMDLQQRGTLTADGKLLSKLFGEFVPEWLPEGQGLDDVLGEIENGIGRGTQFFDMFLKAAEMAGRMRQTFLEGEQKKDD